MQERTEVELQKAIRTFSMKQIGPTDEEISLKLLKAMKEFNENTPDGGVFPEDLML